VNSGYYAQLPCEPITLSKLLLEQHPGIVCKDGSRYLIKKKELEYLASLLTADEQSLFFLPVLIEIVPGQDEMAVISRGRIEEKVISEILGMPVVSRKARIKIYTHPAGSYQEGLRTATQVYLFTKVNR